MCGSTRQEKQCRQIVRSEMLKVSKETWQLIILKDCIPKGLELSCVGLILTLPASSSGSQLKGKRALKKKCQIYGYWSVQSLVLCSPETQARTWEELSTFSWAVVGQLLATGAWRFPRWHTFSLKRRIYTTHVPLQMKKALVLYSYLQHSHCETLFTAEICDRVITVSQ